TASATRLPRLLALSRRRAARAPARTAQAARGHRRARHREEVRGYRPLRPYRLRRHRPARRAQGIGVEEGDVPRAGRAAHRRCADLPLRSRRRRRGTELPAGRGEGVIVFAGSAPLRGASLSITHPMSATEWRAPSSEVTTLSFSCPRRRLARRPPP